MSDQQVFVTLEDYHRWLGELYAEVKIAQKALAVANAVVEPPVVEAPVPEEPLVPEESPKDS